jgi:acyl-CoA reductase-like NAD-dependent aldehyde dehydrogenase
MAITQQSVESAGATTFGLLIDGEVEHREESFDVRSPATGDVVGRAPEASLADLDRAVAAARRAQPAWAADEALRRKVLHDVADVLEAHAEALATLVADETGKPFGAAMFEPLGAVAHIRWIADQELPVTRLSGEGETGVVLEWVPYGVVGAIVPWNVPLIMLLHKFAAMALVGNTVVAKPSPFSPLSSLRAAELVAHVVPAGVLQVLSGGDELGRAIVEHPGIDMIGFTGSSATGSKIMASAARTLKKVSLELGGNDAAIVLPDVDVDAAAERIFGGAFVLSGQACAAIKRLYVHRDVYQPLVDRLVAIAESTKLGDPFDPATTMGPLSTGEQFARVNELVDAARAEGGRIATGGSRVGERGFFFAPTIVEGLADDARLVAEEQFGPVLPVMVFDDVDDAVARANNTPYGLSASVWSQDAAAAAAVARRLTAGTVWVNKHAVVMPHVPFGGAKQSGFGREGGLAGIINYAQLRTVDIDRA